MIWGGKNPNARRKLDHAKMTETNVSKTNFKIKSQTCILEEKINLQSIVKMPRDNLPILSHNETALIIFIVTQHIIFSWTTYRERPENSESLKCLLALRLTLFFRQTCYIKLTSSRKTIQQNNIHWTEFHLKDTGKYYNNLTQKTPLLIYLNIFIFIYKVFYNIYLYL